MPINIHGKEYSTVAERLEQAKDVIKSITTEVLFIEPQVMVKATITTDRGIFTGISAANPKKQIEANTPVEVAETSAVGRALAFAGYAGSEIASADEMTKALAPEREEQAQESGLWCDYHKTKMIQTPRMKSPAHKDDVKGWCNGQGYADERANWKAKVKSDARVDDGYEEHLETLDRN